ncbi:class I SAM-dependent methyltransferase [Algihabitans albus]|uniref:class I SAM-dependent methyltransferase n=1 Tax=Algihabitans albus TaxID=2164067 RepID=UPI001ABCE0AF|nr:class I SAM-dependent methyltransferase [Algihabitans albus]
MVYRLPMREICICPACTNPLSRVVAEATAEARERFIAFSGKKYRGLMDPWLDQFALRVRQCGGCGHAWYAQQPSHDQLMAMYDASQPLRPGEAKHEPSPSMRREMARLRRLSPAQTPTLLDYGAGSGRWAAAAVETGFRVTAFEPSRTRTQERHGIIVIHELDDLAGPFDVVNLEQVLEHLPDPASVLSDIRGLCRDRTVVRITVPNLRRAPEGTDLWRVWPFDGSRPHTLAPFEHLHGFTPESLSILIGRAGFRPLPDWRCARGFTLHTARQALGRALPQVRSTKLLVQPFEQASHGAPNNAAPTRERTESLSQH